MNELRHQVEAYNVSRDAENKIHDDTVARRFGFRGGLVPGAEVYAYMTHLPVRHWGRAWLEGGRAECRFLHPVYDGKVALVTGEESGAGLAIQVESQGALCATGRAELPAQASAPPDLDDIPRVEPAVSRPAADETSLSPGTLLGTAPLAVTRELSERYLRDVRETEPLYSREHLAHPGLVLRLCNAVLREYVMLGPWIHVGSGIQHFSAIGVDDVLSVRARVKANYERKGHRFVDLDALVIGRHTTPIARVTHTAIYRLRQVAEGA